MIRIPFKSSSSISFITTVDAYSGWLLVNVDNAQKHWSSTIKGIVRDILIRLAIFQIAKEDVSDASRSFTTILKLKTAN